ncbi:MAG: type VI secretion system protein TssA [Proteobacteria bacterium]|nr:type VI secretion system protein TssA [Pseudomonadota bacterium]
MSSKKEISKKQTQKEDCDPILKPFEGKEPAGVFLAYDPVYNKIRLARQEDDPMLPQGVWKKTLKVANFKEVEKLATDALSTRTKDFQLMAWLIEAWIKLYQLQGLIRGLKLLNDLCLSFWETGYPPLKRGDNDYRLAPFHWLNEKLSSRLCETFITEKSLSQTVSYRFLDWKEALGLEKIFQKSESPEELEQKAQNEGRPILKNIQAAIAKTPNTFYQTLSESLEAALKETETLEKFLLTHYQSSEISLYTLRRSLKDILNLIDQIKAERKEDVSAEKIEQRRDPVSSSSESTEETPLKDLPLSETLPPSRKQETTPKETPIEKSQTSVSSFNSREEAYRLLQEIQTFLMETEPHSLSPYLIKRALQWEHMSLEEVFQDVLNETTDLNQFLTFLGIQKTSHPSVSE